MKELSLSEQIDKAVPDTIDFLRGLLEIPSLSGHEEAATEYIFNAFRALGCECRLAEIPRDLSSDPLYAFVNGRPQHENRYNVIAKLGSGPGGIVFNTHIDTVPPANDIPFMLRGDVIYGRGTCDAKGQLAVIYLVYKALLDAGSILAAPVTAHFVVEEENGGNGSLAILRSEDMKFDRAVVLEPTQLKIMTAARGAIWFRIKFHGVSGHSGDASKSYSALLYAIQGMKLITAYHQELLDLQRGTSPFEKYANPMPLTFGALHSGRWPSIIPDEAILEGVLGFLPGKTDSDICDELCKALDTEELRGRCEIEFTFRRNPVVTSRDNPLVADMAVACERAGITPVLDVLTCFCDAWIYGMCNIPVVVFGAGSLSDAHSAHEIVTVSELKKAALVLANLIIKEERI